MIFDILKMVFLLYLVNLSLTFQTNRMQSDPTINQEKMKELAGAYAVKFVPDNSVIGLGSGSTVSWFIKALGKKVQEGLRVVCVATSEESAQLAKENGIEVADLNDVDQPIIAIDGADEINQHFSLIKGGGGALLREKMVAAASSLFYVIADQSKLVDLLGRFPVPVEVVPFGWKHVCRKICELDGAVECDLRMKQDGTPFLTDNGNFIIDCHFHRIYKPYDLQFLLKNIPGVVEHGLFVRMTNKIIVAFADGKVHEFDNYLRK